MSDDDDDDEILLLYGVRICVSFAVYATQIFDIIASNV